MKLIFLIALASFLVSCSTPIEPLETHGQKVIIDTSPIANPATASLQDLALALPVFEGGYEETRRWVVEEDGVINEPGKWTIRHDGAQMFVMAEELKPAKSGARKIRLTLVEEPDGESEEVWTYLLQRVPGGWKILRKSSRK